MKILLVRLGCLPGPYTDRIPVEPVVPVSSVYVVMLSVALESQGWRLCMCVGYTHVLLIPPEPTEPVLSVHDIVLCLGRGCSMSMVHVD